MLLLLRSGEVVEGRIEGGGGVDCCMGDAYDLGLTTGVGTCDSETSCLSCDSWFDLSKAMPL